MGRGWMGWELVLFRLAQLLHRSADPRDDGCHRRNEGTSRPHAGHFRGDAARSASLLGAGEPILSAMACPRGLSFLLRVTREL